MNDLKKVFHALSYIQYPLLLIGLFLLINPFLKGFDYVSLHPEYIFQNYNSALVFFGLTLSFAALQDSQKTSLRYEKRIWSNPKKARTVIFFTLFTMALFFITGLLGFIVKESIIKEFAYGSLVLAIGLLGYFKLQMEIFENHSN